MTEQYPEQQHPRRRVRGYAPPIALPDVEGHCSHYDDEQPYRDRLTEEDEALGYPDVAPDRPRSSLVRRRAPFQGGDDDVDVLNIIVTPRRSTHQSAGPHHHARRASGMPQAQASSRASDSRSSSTPALLPAPPRRRVLWHRLRRHPGTLLALGLGMSLMVSLMLLISILGPIWQGWQDTWQYGYPRTYQTDAVVGHEHDSAAHPSHFLAENLHGAILVIEFPAGSIAHPIAYTGPTFYGAGADTTPVTLTFKDVTGDGAPDLIIHAGATITVLVNDPAHNDFRPLRPGDHVSGV